MYTPNQEWWNATFYPGISLYSTCACTWGHMHYASWRGNTCTYAQVIASYTIQCSWELSGAFRTEGTKWILSIVNVHPWDSKNCPRYVSSFQAECTLWGIDKISCDTHAIPSPWTHSVHVHTFLFVLLSADGIYPLLLFLWRLGVQHKPLVLGNVVHLPTIDHG